MTRTWNQPLLDDHEITEKALAAVALALNDPAPDRGLVRRTVEYLVGYVDRIHNQKEEQHLFPLLERRGIPRQAGPLAVMLQEHEETRDLLGRLTPLAERYAAGAADVLPELRKAFDRYSTVVKGHF